MNRSRVSAALPLVLALSVFLFAACGDNITTFSNGDGGSLGDSDGDGLSDTEEREIYHTSPVLADTDGDGYSDYDEVVEKGFNPDHDNFKFNPVIADIAIVQVSFLTAPDIRLQFSTKAEESVERSETSSVTTTDMQSHTGSFQMELSVSETAKVGVTDSSAEVSASISVAFGYEGTHEWGTEQTTENSKAYGKTATTEFTGGILSLALQIENPGDVAYTMTNLVLGGTAVLAGRGDKLRPVGNLGIDTVDFNGFTIGPHSSAGPLVFSTEMGVGLTRQLLRDSTGLAVAVAAREILDTDGVSYTQRETDIMAKAATIFIDYGPTGDLFIEKHTVATNIDPDVLHVTMQQVMEQLLAIPHTVQADVGLTEIRGVTGSPADPNLQDKVIWGVVHHTKEFSIPVVNVYDPSVGYDFNAIEVFSGDLVRLVFLNDADDDGIGLREERIQGIAGTNPDEFCDPIDDKDWDGDGISDYDEIYVGWIDGFSHERVFSSPKICDTDGDLLTDAEEMAASTNPTRSDTDGDGESDYQELNPVAGPPTNPLVNETAIQWKVVDAGYWHSLGIKEDGTLWAWGSNEAGQLGLGDTAMRSAPTQVGTDIDWMAVAGGKWHSLALKTDARLYSWGYNARGELGQGATPAGQTTCTIDGLPQNCVLNPQQEVTGAVDWSRIAAGEHHSLARKTGGTLWAWGLGVFGQLGQGEISAHADPTQVGIATDWVEIAAGGHHSLANKANGQVYSWGYNANGQLGLGDYFNRVFPTTAITQATILGAGHSNSVIITVDGDSFIAGSNEYRQLTYSGPSNALWMNLYQANGTAPVQVGATDVGRGTAYVVRETINPGRGELWANGDNTYGQAGLGFIGGANHFPTRVGSSQEYFLVSAGYAHVLALKTDGSLKPDGTLNTSLVSWGDNVHGQTGRGDPTQAAWFTLPDLVP